MITAYPNIYQYQLAVAQGKISGAQPLAVAGKRVAAGAETNTLVWADGSIYFPAVGVQPTIVSTSANDAAAGTGIRTVHVHYLDNSLNEQVEVVTMNGVTPVTLAATNVRFVQYIHAETAGSGGVAAGTITCANGANTFNIISTSALTSQSSIRVVPAGKVIYVHALAGGSSSGSAAASVQLEFVASQIDATPNASNLLYSQGMIALQDNSVTLSLPMPARFSAGTVIAMRMICDKAATVGATWYGWQENA